MSDLCHLNQIQKDVKENLKIKYKNERFQEIKQIYLCQCQKWYLSFPALYLHVKNKHNIKLTTKINENICKIEHKQGKAYITYFLNSEPKSDSLEQLNNSLIAQKNHLQNSPVKTHSCASLKRDSAELSEEQMMKANLDEEKQKNFIHQNNKKSIAQQYLNDIRCYNSQDHQKFNFVLQNLMNYFQRCQQYSKQFDGSNSQVKYISLQQIPLYFNQFAIYYWPKFVKPYYGEILSQMELSNVLYYFSQWLNSKNYSKFSLALVNNY